MIDLEKAKELMKKAVDESATGSEIAERFIESVYFCGYDDGAMQAIDELPSADVVQVIHGKWIKEDRGHVEYCAVCDQCGFDWMWSDRGYFKFCPNCGAKMDGR